MPEPLDQQSHFAHSLREMRIAWTLWVVMLCVSVGGSLRFGYNRPADSLVYYFGFPDWVFWCVIVPWGVSTLFSIWFALYYMQDDPTEDPHALDSSEARP